MTLWSKASNKFGADTSNKFSAHSREHLPGEFRQGIDLTLEHLIEMRHQNILQWLAVSSRVKTNRIGGFQSRFKGRGMDFDEVRLYQMGDDIRSIDWKVTARTGEAHTKLFKEERERPVFTLIDLMPSQFFGTTEAFKSQVACKVAAQLMWNAVSHGDRFGALVFSQNRHLEMKPSSSRKACMRLLNRIVEEHQQSLSEIFNDAQTQQTEAEPPKVQKRVIKTSSHPLNESLNRLHFLAKPGSLVHIVSDFNQFNNESQKRLNRLSQHLDIHCILISDAIEKDLPPEGIYGITDGLSEAVLDTKNLRNRNSHKDQFNQKIETVKNFALSHRGIFSHINTDYQQLSSHPDMKNLGGQ